MIGKLAFLTLSKLTTNLFIYFLEWRAKTHNLSQPLLKATTKAKVNRQPTRYLNLANLYFSTIF